MIHTGSSVDLALHAYACSLAARPFWPADPARPLPTARQAASAELIISTSGSEGEAKAVLLSANNLDAAATASNQRLPLGPGDIWLNCLPLFHIGGCSILWRCAKAGATVLLHDGFVTEAVARTLHASPVTHISLVPAMLARLLDQGCAPPASLRCALIGGAALSPTLFERARAAGWPLFVTYGMSETAAQIATFDATQHTWQEGLVGHPLSGVELAIGEDGRIGVRGPQVMAGYLDGPVLEDGWFSTGDLGQLQPDGQLQIIGRADDMLVSGGKKVHPLTVESCLAACPGVLDVAVTGSPHPEWGDEIVALVVSRPSAPHHLPAAPAAQCGRQAGTDQAAPTGSRRRRMIARLRTLLRSPDFARQLARRALDLPSAALLSLNLDLGDSPRDWLDQLPEEAIYWYRAQPEKACFLLGLGQAVHLASRGRDRFAALQHALSGTTRHWHYDRQPTAFLGFAFFDQGGGDLPNALLSIPALLLECRAGQCSATLTTLAGNHPSAVEHWLALLQPITSRLLPAIPRRRPQPLPDRAWLARVQAALRDIAAERLDKVVLTRSATLTADRPFPVAATLRHLVTQQPASTVYAYGDGQRSFLGASPEQLLSLRCGELEADALAGTAWQGSRQLDDEKNAREQALVSQAVRHALAPLCRNLQQAPQPEAVAAGTVTHLRSRIRGQLRPEVQLFDALHALHPTPAVGGTPTTAALHWLRNHHEERSAWYTGGIGIVGPDGDGEITVALRSALLSGQQAELHAGAGIVAGSDPIQEFAETEAKFRTMLDALQPARLWQESHSP